MPQDSSNQSDHNYRVLIKEDFCGADVLARIQLLKHNTHGKRLIFLQNSECTLAPKTLSLSIIPNFL